MESGAKLTLIESESWQGGKYNRISLLQLTKRLTIKHFFALRAVFFSYSYRTPPAKGPTAQFPNKTDFGSQMCKQMLVELQKRLITYRFVSHSPHMHECLISTFVSSASSSSHWAWMAPSNFQLSHPLSKGQQHNSRSLISISRVLIARTRIVSH